ncbi:MAG: family 10 glycosylhydrolase [Defluviitaleaceae bacterium]|nr:family 10 glycosylhydrolase [Defluviitaleaceae bacterium]
MKKLKNLKPKYVLSLCFIALILAIGAIVPNFQAQANPANPGPGHLDEMRGVWVTSAYNLDFPSRRGLSVSAMRAEINDILARTHELGLNAVFLQVRPAADALYRSHLFPWSAQITGTQGLVPPDGFDPLAYWIEQAHALGIQVHAWINPYRITFPNQNITNVNQLSHGHPARENPSWAIAYNNALFFNPGLPEVRQLIADGVAEIIRDYNIDGIHFDDYFYPSRNFPDQATFAAHGGGMDIHDWRRENVNAMIQLVQATVRDIDPDVRFGISPTAIWQNRSNNPLGSDTRGNESYHALYADTRRWVLEGWVDYIVPQIYWYIGRDGSDYELVLSWWEDLTAGTNVDLYVGIAIYREVLSWDNWEGEVLRQLERNALSDEVNGSIFFRHTHMLGAVGDSVGRFFEMNIPEPTPRPTPAPIVLMEELMVVQPSRDFTVHDATGFNFFGSAVPGVPVYINGELITNRTSEGFFSIFMPIVRGQNTFTFTQEGQQSITRVVTNTAPPQATPAPPMTEAAVINVAPATTEWASPGVTVNLRATAPAGATVTVVIAGETITLEQANPNLTATASNITPAVFTGTFTPADTPSYDQVIDLGRPVYTMTWNGATATATAAGSIMLIGPDARLYAEVTVDYAWVFPGATTTGGSHWMIHRGQRDRVAAVRGDWTQLASGVWIESANIRTWVDEYEPTQEVALAGYLSEGRYLAGEYKDVIIWNTDIFPVVYGEFDGSQLIVAMGLQQQLPPIFVTPGSTLFESITIGTHNNAPAYFMNLKPEARLEGFYVEYDEGELRLVLRRRRALAEGNYPLSGFHIVLDAGHGGQDSGALGPMGSQMAEAHIVLTNVHLLSQRLQLLGAEVTIVRDTDDAFYTLQERVNISRGVKPDMFISIHANSTAETTNATNIHGFTMWHRNPNSLPLATHFMESLHYINPLTTRHRTVHQANFFVCRPVWAPSVIVEISFMNNIQDFAWMINPHHQNELAWGMVNAILGYFRD